MNLETRSTYIQQKQRRASLMLQHIMSRLPDRYQYVEQWLSLPQNHKRPQYIEWGQPEDWMPRLQWMHENLLTEWDEVERLMSNHPFSCIIDQKRRQEILSSVPLEGQKPVKWREFSLAELA